MLIEVLGQDLVHGEAVDLLDLGVILQPKFAGRVGEGQQLGILGCETAPHLGRHRFVGLVQRIGELLKLLTGEAADTAGGRCATGFRLARAFQRDYGSFIGTLVAAGAGWQPSPGMGAF